MKKLLQEFKAFINKGNVMDLAVGMIIGSAFTAIVTALVQNILTPLINWIPGTGDTGALQTVLREAITDEAGNVVTPALILDWGAVISAIITFLCTAIVLFVIVKLFNKMKEAGEKAKEAAAHKDEQAAEEAAEAPVEEAAPEVAPVEEVKPSESEMLPTRDRQHAKKTKRKRNACAFCLHKIKVEVFQQKVQKPHRHYSVVVYPRTYIVLDDYYFAERIVYFDK